MNSEAPETVRKDTSLQRVLLLGNGTTSLSALKSLAKSFSVIRVLRNESNDDTDPVRLFARESGIPVSALRDVNELAILVAELQPAAVVISSFDRILPASTLRLSRFVNVHYSLLPRYRGRANVNWAIINGESSVGISIHVVTPGLDSGNLLFQGSVPVAAHDTVGSIYDQLNAIQERELGNAVARAIGGDNGTPQDNVDVTYGCARTPEDGEIDWRQPTTVIDRLVRALTNPFPGAFTYLDTQKLSVLRAEPLDNPRLYAGRIPGRVVGRSAKEGWVDVLTGDGVLRLLEIAVDSAPDLPRTAAEFIVSTRATLGLSRSDLLKKLRELEKRVHQIETARINPKSTAP